MWLLYDLIIHLFGDSISVAALFSPKARKWVAGRKGLLREIELAVGSRQSAPSLDPSPGRGRERPGLSQAREGANIWFHCASLGEFEQGRPVMEAFRQAHPDWKIVLTFFSPSGYEIRKNYPGADHVFYLPLDTPRNAKQFIRLIRPSIAVFVKYEFWFRHLDVLHREMIPAYVISAIFRPGQHFFRWYGGWALKQLHKVTHFFVQDEASAELLKTRGITQVTVSGDTRFDRVAAIATGALSFPLVEKFVGNMPVFIAGSTWPADEELILELIGKHGDRMKFIIAPHEVQPARVEALKLRVEGLGSLVVGRFTELDDTNSESMQVLIIDSIGFLAHLYQYATIAYIGGGFGVGIHNILEAAAFGKPVIFGPNYSKFREAKELLAEGGAFSITDYIQLNNRTIGLLGDSVSRQKSSEICRSYVKSKTGATDLILSHIANDFSA